MSKPIYVRPRNYPLALRNAGPAPLRWLGHRLIAAEARRFRLAGAHGAERLISVVMTAYNAEAFVAEAVETVLNQSHRKLELIVVDDASEDDTSAVLQKLASRDPRLKVFRATRNRGTYWAKNAALLRARGEFVALHDSDDWSHPERLATQLGAILSRNGAIASICSGARVDHRRRPVPVNGREVRMIGIGLMFAREAVLGRVGYFDSVRIAADSEFIERMVTILGSRAIVRVNEMLYEVRQRADSLTADQKAGTSAGGGLRHTPGGVRARYIAAYRAWHAQNRATPKRLWIAFPQAERAFPAPAELVASGDGEREDVGLEAVAPADRSLG